MRGPALQNAKELLETSACFSQPRMQSYPWLGSHLNQVLCQLNLVFDAGTKQAKEPAVLLNTFGPLFMTAVAIATYEGFRPIHRGNKGPSGVIARAASWFALLGQRVTAGFALPLQRAFIQWSAARKQRYASDHEELSAWVPKAKYVWSTLLSLIIGMVVPTLYMQSEGFSYEALSIWQPFPVYVLALNIVLPYLLGWTRNRYVPTVLLTALLIGASVRSNLELVKGIGAGEIDFRKAFLIDLPADKLALSSGAHILFGIDMASVFILNTLVVLFGYGAGIGGFLAQLLPFTIATVFLGPGGSFALFWGYKEIKRLRALGKAGSPVSRKLKRN